MTTLDAIRSKALDELDRARRGFLAAIIAGTVFEGACLLALMVTIDFKDPLHRVILFATGLIYLPMTSGR